MSEARPVAPARRRALNVDRAGGLIWLAALYFVVPSGVALLMGATWRTLICAYGVWVGFLAFWPLSARRGNTRSEMAGWAAIMAIFFTTPSIALLTLVLLIAGVR